MMRIPLSRSSPTVASSRPTTSASQCMSASPSEQEALGDWNNLKGTRYHLVYALWLLLCELVAEVRFYEGNDLSVSPTAPPGSVVTDPIPVLASPDRSVDVWVQLKATSTRGSLPNWWVITSWRTSSATPPCRNRGVGGGRSAS